MSVLSSEARIGGGPGTATLPPGSVRSAAADAVGHALTQTGTVTGSQQSARGYLNAVLAQYGLQSLGDTVWQWYLNGKSTDQIMLDIRNTPQYQKRFPAMKTLAQEGRAITEQQYIDYESNVAQLAHAYGVPVGFFNPQRVADLLTGDVSVQELGDRLGMYGQVLSDPAVAARWQQMSGSSTQLTPGELAAFVADPKWSEQAIAKRFNTAVVGAASDQAGVAVSNSVAEQLAGMGVSQAQARQGFATIVQNQPLFGPLPGTAETRIGLDTAVGATFAGNAQDQAEIEKRRRERLAQFGGGNQFLSTNGGFTGVGTAQGS